MKLWLTRVPNALGTNEFDCGFTPRGFHRETGSRNQTRWLAQTSTQSNVIGDSYSYSRCSNRPMQRSFSAHVLNLATDSGWTIFLVPQPRECSPTAPLTLSVKRSWLVYMHCQHTRPRVLGPLLIFSFCLTSFFRLLALNTPDS
jgi:hypothetical protein